MARAYLSSSVPAQTYTIVEDRGERERHTAFPCTSAAIAAKDVTPLRCDAAVKKALGSVVDDEFVLEFVSRPLHGTHPHPHTGAGTHAASFALAGRLPAGRTLRLRTAA